MATWESIVIKYSMYNCYLLKNSKVLSHPCTDSKRWSHSYPICSLIGLAFRHPLPRHCKGRKSRTGSTMIGLKIAWFKYVKLWWKTTELFVSRFLALWYDLGLISDIFFFQNTKNDEGWLSYLKVRILLFFFYLEFNQNELGWLCAF